MRKATEQDLPVILPFLRAQVSDCLYMYIDIGKYGLSNSAMDVWVDEDEKGLSLVVMKYHTSISFQSRDDSWDLDGVAKLIEEFRPKSITAPEAMVRRLEPMFEAQYEIEYGNVYSFTDYTNIELDVKIDRASEEETLEIARLIKTDPGIGAYYDEQDLADQLAERMRTGMGRSYVIRDQGRIVTHIASYAEFDGLATTGGLIVAPEYRTTLYGAYIEKYLVDTLNAEGYNVYTFVTTKLRKRLLKAMGNQCVGTYGKMMIRE